MSVLRRVAGIPVLEEAIEDGLQTIILPYATQEGTLELLREHIYLDKPFGMRSNHFADFVWIGHMLRWRELVAWCEAELVYRLSWRSVCARSMELLREKHMTDSLGVLGLLI